MSESNLPLQPALKRIKICEIKSDFSYNEIVRQLGTKMEEIEQRITKQVTTCHEQLKNVFMKKLYATEVKLDALQGICELILQKLEDMEERNRSDEQKADTEKCNESMVLAKTDGSQDTYDSYPKVIKLNSEQDYPNGSWLGDEQRPEARVRCKLSEVTMTSINDNCPTPEKMALTLMDYLFDKNVLAMSNISGKSKHSKKQLDPLMIYGIHCHLIHKFNISISDWQRIKQNMDSKCRSLWRKRKKFEQDKRMEPPVQFVRTAQGIEVITAQQVFQSPGFLKIRGRANTASSPSLQVEDGSTHSALQVEDGSTHSALQVEDAATHSELQVEDGSYVSDLSGNSDICEQHHEQVKEEQRHRYSHIVLEERDAAEFEALSTDTGHT